MPTSHVLVKKVNGNPSAVPTQDDYAKFSGLTGGGGGPYVDCGSNKGDGTCDSTGNFFWSFNGTSSSETTTVFSSYLNMLLGPPMSLKATVPNFKQGDDYYLYVVNTSSSKPTDVYLRVYCY
jgi:hypothetical protein